MQLNLFPKPLFKFTKPIRLIELFAGYGSQALAFKYLGKEIERYKVVEFDRFCINSYNEIHGTDFETSDITNVKGRDLEIVDKNKYDYFVTYSFPCQDISLAGLGAGIQKGTRSGLLYEVERILQELKEFNALPQVLMMENVKNLLGSKHIEAFTEWVQFLESLGYSNCHQVLNAKHYKVPQNRERVFMFSFLGEYDYYFPKAKPFETKLKDLLEETVDPKYFLNEKMLERFMDSRSRNGYIRSDRFKPKIFKSLANDDTASTLQTRNGGRPTENYFTYSIEEFNKIIVLGNYAPGGHGATRVIDIEGISPAVMDNHGLGTAAIAVPEKTLKGYTWASDGDGIYIDRPYQKRGVVQKSSVPAITCSGRKIGVVLINGENFVIRRLTPLESFRLMGVKDEDYNKLTCSETQKYKQAGNSIVVDVMVEMFRELF